MVSKQVLSFLFNLWKAKEKEERIYWVTNRSRKKLLFCTHRVISITTELNSHVMGWDPHSVVSFPSVEVHKQRLDNACGKSWHLMVIRLCHLWSNSILGVNESKLYYSTIHHWNISTENCYIRRHNSIVLKHVNCEVRLPGTKSGSATTNHTMCLIVCKFMDELPHLQKMRIIKGYASLKIHLKCLEHHLTHSKCSINC